MKCPNCGLINPDSALRCNCGYDFATMTVARKVRAVGLAHRLLHLAILASIPGLLIPYAFPVVLHLQTCQGFRSEYSFDSVVRSRHVYTFGEPRLHPNTSQKSREAPTGRKYQSGIHGC